MTLQIIPVPLDVDVKQNDNIVDLMLSTKTGSNVKNGDIVIFTQKIISKQEGQKISINKIHPTLLATGIASTYGKDPRIIQLVLKETKRLVRMKNGIIISETRHGFVCANAGVDESNVEEGYATLLPKDPDVSAKKLRRQIKTRTGKNVGVIISDTFGRPFREGQTDVAIGTSGISSIVDYAGKKDTFGRRLRVTAIAVSDELSAASELVRGKSFSTPIAIIRNYSFGAKNDTMKKTLRKKSLDLFR